MLISPKATLGLNVTIHEGTVIEDSVSIGDNVSVGYNVIIRENVKIEDNCFIADNTVLGKLPMKAAMSATTSLQGNIESLSIGKGASIGAGCVIYNGAKLGAGVFVGDLASIRENVHIGELSIIGRGVAVENKVTIGRKVKIETNAYITALSIIEDYCFIAPGAMFTNDNYLGRTEDRKKFFKGVTLRKGARVGANATVLPGLEIGEDALVGAGSVVTKNVPAKTIVCNCPAVPLRMVPENQLIQNQLFYDD